MGIVRHPLGPNNNRSIDVYPLKFINANRFGVENQDTARRTASYLSNYRPISLTSICCKVMEHIVLSHMAKHLSGNNILINEQHGFRQRFSCETQLISALHDWAKSINSRSQTDVILLDFSKAFDSVPHQIKDCY